MQLKSRRFAFVLALTLVIVGSSTRLHGQTFTAQIQQFWNLLRTGSLQFTTLNAVTARVPNTLNSSGSVTALLFPNAQLSGTDAFSLTFGAAANAGDGTRGDIAAVWGWNVVGDGSVQRVSGEPSIMWRWENYYQPGSGGCNALHGCQEAHLQWITSDGTVVRPIGWQGIDTSKNSTLVFSNDSVSFLDRTGATQYVKISTGVMQLFNNTAIQQVVNNLVTFTQLNNAGNRFNSLIFGNNTDSVVVGDGNTNGWKKLTVWLGDTVQLGWLGGTAPTCPGANCGTGATVSGNNISGTLTMGGTGTPASPFVFTFNGTWTNAPRCSFWMSKAGMATGKKPILVVMTTTTATVTTDGVNPANGDTYDYHCESN